MRITLLALAVVLSLGIATATLTAAPGDEVMSFQGRLTDKDGFPLNGTYRLSVRIYAAETGGAPVFTEAFAGVTVTNGIFHVLLGKTVDLSLDAATKYWVGLEVDSDGEMTPRIRLARGHLVGPKGNDGVDGVAGLKGDKGDKGEPGTVAFGGTVTGSSSSHGVQFKNTGSGYGIRGEAVTGVGVYGYSVSANGIYGSSVTQPGVFGTSSSNYGVRGQSTSNIGVYGFSTSASGMVGDSTSSIGVQGISQKTYGVYGKSTSSHGVYGTTNRSGSSYFGVYGSATSATGVRGTSTAWFGVWGNSVSNHAVYGQTSANSAIIGAVHGSAASAVGVYGVSTTRYGVRGKSTNSFGMFGESTSNHGVYGTTSRSSSSYAALYGTAASAVGVRAISTVRYGVWGSSSSQIGVYGSSSTNAGVWGETSSASDYAGYFRNLASSSSGNGVYVNGKLLVTGTKSFVQRHPTDRKKAIVYVCLEGGEAGTYCRGSGQLQNGRTRIDLPEHFRLVTAGQGLTAVVTPTSMCAGLMVVEKTNSYIVVQELGNGKSAATFDWKVNGLRAGYEDHEPITSAPSVMKGLDMGDRDVPAGGGRRK